MINFWQNTIAKFEKNHTKIITKIAAKNLIIFQSKHSKKVKRIFTKFSTKN